MSNNQDFQTFKIYTKVADDIEKTNPTISYYLKTYTLNKALEFLKQERAQGRDVSSKMNEIRPWLQDLESLKVNLSTELSDKERCKQKFRDYGLNIFQQSEKEFRSGIYSRRLAKDFLYVSVLFDAWELVGGQTEDIRLKKNYANDARFKIMAALDNGTVPAQNVVLPKGNTPTPAVETKKDELKNETIDPLSKLNFELTESIFVPKTAIDKFLDIKAQTPRPNTGFIAQTPNPVTGTPGNWNIPQGQSIVLAPSTTTSAVNRPSYETPNGDPTPNPNLQRFQTMPVTPTSNNTYFNTPNPQQNQYPNQIHFQGAMTQPPYQQGLPGTPGQYGAQMAPSHGPYQGFTPNYMNQTPMGMQQYQLQVTNNGYVMPNGQNNQGQFFNMGNQYMATPGGGQWTIGSDGMRGVEVERMGKPADSNSKCTEAKECLMKVASELNVRNVKEAKENVYKILRLLEQIELEQNL